jgi:hypothetical protein
MIQHLSDDDITIGFYQVDQDMKKVAKKISSLLGSTFEVVTSDKYQGVGDFEIDTLIIRSNLFSEDLLDLLDYGIAVYIIDF